MKCKGDGSSSSVERERINVSFYSTINIIEAFLRYSTQRARTSRRPYILSMSKVYDIAFRMGVLFNVVLWTTVNLIDFISSRDEFLRQEAAATIRFSGFSGYKWGMPFDMFRNEMIWEPYALVLNAVVYVTCGFLFGFLFKFVRSKSSSGVTPD
jgi:hypothetical protein